MFLRAFVEIGLPVEGAASILKRLPQVLVEGFADEAVGRTDAVLTQVGFAVRGGRVARRVEIVVGGAVETPTRTWLPLIWKVTSAAGLFPSLEGELEAASLGSSRTQIGLSARYKPPFGVVGSTVDRMFLHRVAEATVQDFIQRVAGAVEAEWRLQQITGNGLRQVGAPG
jgi:hypothetical protein